MKDELGIVKDGVGALLGQMADWWDLLDGLDKKTTLALARVVFEKNSYAAGGFAAAALAAIALATAAAICYEAECQQAEDGGVGRGLEGAWHRWRIRKDNAPEALGQRSHARARTTLTAFAMADGEGAWHRWRIGKDEG